MQRGTSTEILIGGRNLASIVLWSPNCHSKTAAAIFSLAAAAGWTSRTSTCLLPFSSMLSTRVTGTSSACSSRTRWKHCSSGMYSTVSSMLRGSGRMIQRATTMNSLPLSKSLLRTLLKKVSVSRRKVASFRAGTRYQSGHLADARVRHGVGRVELDRALVHSAGLRDGLPRAAAEKFARAQHGLVGRD